MNPHGASVGTAFLNQEVQLKGPSLMASDQEMAFKWLILSDISREL